MIPLELGWQLLDKELPKPHPSLSILSCTKSPSQASFLPPAWFLPPPPISMALCDCLSRQHLLFLPQELQ
jgi:hypothetical protein